MIPREGAEEQRGRADFPALGEAITPPIACTSHLAVSHIRSIPTVSQQNPPQFGDLTKGSWRHAYRKSPCPVFNAVRGTVTHQSSPNHPSCLTGFSFILRATQTTWITRPDNVSARFRTFGSIEWLMVMFVLNQFLKKQRFIVFLLSLAAIK